MTLTCSLVKIFRVQKQMVTLDTSQRGQLERWQDEYKTLSQQQSKTENDLKRFESLALDVDGAKEQCADLKVHLRLCAHGRRFRAF